MEHEHRLLHFQIGIEQKVEKQTPAEPERPKPAPPTAPSVAELVRVTPPRYVPVTLRGPTDEAAKRFREAMQHYAKGKYGAAILGLRAAAELDPRAPNVQFFLGICYLLTGQIDTAIAELKKTVALGDSPYLEEAHFYLAKAFLRQGNVVAARNELKKTIELRGELESEAQKLLGQLQMLSKTPR